ncbi:MAG: spore coat protein [Ruminococcaceae bacterium]|nr:spore coat protein [Oscillospiraceae bacterium]
MNQQKKQLSEREMLTDGLSSQRHIASGYNTYAGECTNKQLRSAFINILAEEQDLGAQVYENMSARGWYQEKEADESNVAKVKQRFLSTTH